VAGGYPGKNIPKENGRRQDFVHEESGKKPITIYGAIIANLIVAGAKFIVAAFTGSSAMISEGIHSVVDTGNQLLLLLGTRLSKRPVDDIHPFGHGNFLYFWGLMLGFVLFGVGGGMTIYEGIIRLQRPMEMGDPFWNYLVLAVAFIAEGISFGIALKAFFRTKGKEHFWTAIHNSKDPSIFVVLFEDATDLVGLVIAGLGVFLGRIFKAPYLDGVASVLIGVLLSGVAVILAYESRNLLLGESASDEIVQKIRALAEQDKDVVAAKRPLTMHMGPDEVLLNLDIQFKEGLSGRELSGAIDRLEKSIREEIPIIKRIFIEADSITKTNPPEKGYSGR
jgi:cation diffusion facilitator family transporter